MECYCYCPSCYARLVARKGELKGAHFAHYNAEDFSWGAETDLHLLAKEILSEVKQITLPPYRYLTHQIFPKTTIDIDPVVVEQKLGAVKPDILLVKEGRELMVEIAVTHNINCEKQLKTREMGIAIVEVNLSTCSRTPNKAELCAILLNSDTDKKWIYNGKAEQKVAQIVEAEQVGLVRANRMIQEGEREHQKRMENGQACIPFMYSRKGYTIRTQILKDMWFQIKYFGFYQAILRHKPYWSYEGGAIEHSLDLKYRVSINGREIKDARNIETFFLG